MRTATISVSDPFEVADEYFRNRLAMRSPALYFIDEIEVLIDRTAEERREIHKAKLAYGAVRLMQHGR